MGARPVIRKRLRQISPSGTNRNTSMPRKKTAKKATRAPRGDGSIFFDNRREEWVAKLPIGRDPDTRDLIYQWFRAPTQDAVRKLRDAARPAAIGPSMTLGAWCDRWLKTLDIAAQSIDEYETAVRLRIKPALGALRLAALTPFLIEEAAKKWGQGAGANTVLKTMAVLSGALQAAHRGDLVTRNASRPARKPAAPEIDIDPFAPAELLAIVAAGLDRPEWRTFSACAATGCRIGEAMALDDTNYDATTGRLRITGTRTRRHGIGKPKSRRGARTVSVPVAARPVLAAGLTPTNYTTAHARWARLLEHLGLRYRGTHQMRHSVATHAIAAGTPIANVARDLGDTVEVIVRTYLHPTDDGRDVSAALDRLFAKP